MTQGATTTEARRYTPEVALGERADEFDLLLETQFNDEGIELRAELTLAHDAGTGTRYLPHEAASTLRIRSPKPFFSMRRPTASTSGGSSRGSAVRREAFYVEPVRVDAPQGGRRPGSPPGIGG